MVADEPQASDNSIQTLSDGSTVTIRPMGEDDLGPVLQFARSLSDHDLLFLRRDITVAADIVAWLSDVEAGRNFTQMAFQDDRLVGYASVSISHLHWKQHVAELRVLTSPLVRGKGLGRLLTNDAFRLAMDIGVEKMVAQMTPDQEAAVGVFYRLGFEQEARLRAEVRDRDGRKHDLLVLSLDVSSHQETRRAREASAG
jgi:L-amino acid N-acyltransferase YncA